MQHLHVFDDLSQQEKKQMIRFPVYISLLAASKDCNLDKQEKITAIKLTHIKTFSCDPVLADYYSAVDQDFEKDIAEISERLPKEHQERELVIRRELRKLEDILAKMDKEYAAIMHHSLRSYKDHVSRAHRNILEYFLFPLPLKGLTD